MKVSLNWVKKYVDLPETLTPAQIAYDMTLRTVEVEGTEDTGAKFHDIVVGKVLEVKEHPNAGLVIGNVHLVKGCFRLVPAVFILKDRIMVGADSLDAALCQDRIARHLVQLELQ